MARGQTSTTWRARPTTMKCVTALLRAIVVVLVIIVIAWTVIRPSKLRISVGHATMHGGFGPFSFTSGGALNGTFDITLRSFNRHKRATVSYQSLEVEVWYDDSYLAGDVVPAFGFDQPPRNETRIDVVAPAATEALRRGVQAAMKKDRSRANLPVEVPVRAKAWLRYGIAKTRLYAVRASCPVVIIFASPSSFDRVYCHVRI